MGGNPDYVMVEEDAVNVTDVILHAILSFEPRWRGDWERLPKDAKNTILRACHTRLQRIELKNSEDKEGLPNQSTRKC